jgi:hypothetical protein
MIIAWTSLPASSSATHLSRSKRVARPARSESSAPTAHRPPGARQGGNRCEVRGRLGFLPLALETRLLPLPSIGLRRNVENELESITSHDSLEMRRSPPQSRARYEMRSQRKRSSFCAIPPAAFRRGRFRSTCFWGRWAMIRRKSKAIVIRTTAFVLTGSERFPTPVAPPAVRLDTTNPSE